MGFMELAIAHVKRYLRTHRHTFSKETLDDHTWVTSTTASCRCHHSRPTCGTAILLSQRLLSCSGALSMLGTLLAMRVTVIGA